MTVAVLEAIASTEVVDVIVRVQHLIEPATISLRPMMVARVLRAARRARTPSQQAHAGPETAARADPEVSAG